MKITGLHFLLSYQCTFECDHCFVWGSPWQTGTLTLEHLRQMLDQAHEAGTVTGVYFEGGEPFLYYPVLLKSVQEAAGRGYTVGIVSNAYWALTEEDALEWLRPLAGLVQNLTLSSDLFHYSETLSRQARNAQQAAESLGIPTGMISIARPENADAPRVVGQLPLDQSGVMYRGRAVEKLAPQAAKQPWTVFNKCPYENLRQPGRGHVEPFGHMHVCQGISLGNLLTHSLKEVAAAYNPDEHPICGPLLAGGPAEMVRRYDLPHEESYADACHLCYSARLALRERFPEILLPDQMYGVA